MTQCRESRVNESCLLTNVCSDEAAIPLKGFTNEIDDAIILQREYTCYCISSQDSYYGPTFNDQSELSNMVKSLSYLPHDSLL